MEPAQEHGSASISSSETVEASESTSESSSQSTLINDQDSQVEIKQSGFLPQTGAQDTSVLGAGLAAILAGLSALGFKRKKDNDA
ncbi:LPXTG cell wall anchor domain-containing protein [Aerococcus urinae]|uniref:LPXTG cell wall anchor domain-containing protein n=1 Tax=Aerococcus urinae TaxID=1376 RepID=UPI00254A94E5|nr:LPXTG cell wall anchor domain-containing protein [Aerococcus urinae]MDK7303549.1 LPXTG cell wall anchor domain-containing protein [Aerococcus urinae]